MEHLVLPVTGQRLPEKPPSQEVMARARQARADALFGMMSGLARRLRSVIVLLPLPAREMAAGNGASNELRERHRA